MFRPARNPILCLALLAAFSTTAAAQSLDALLVGLAAAEGENVQLAALAACLQGGGDAEVTAGLFTGAGWTREDDDEMGMTYLGAPSAPLGATLAIDGGYCEVASGSIGTPTANATVSRMAIEGQMMMGMAEGTDCPGFTLGDAVVVVTSTGQDPTCNSDTDSVIRVSFPK
jgi:hypothetical protein